MAIEALIFDVDGTMADTEEAHRLAFNLAFERHRLGWVWEPGVYRELLKVTGGKERIASHLESLVIATPERRRLRETIPAIHAEKTRIFSGFVADGAVPLRVGVARLMDEALAAGCKLAIASTTTAANVDALLQSAFGSRGIDRFSVIACGDQVPAKKPAPDIFRLALANLGVQPEHAVAVEDSANGVRAAVGARLWTLVTPSFWTRGDDFSGASLELPELGDPDRPLAGEPGGRLQDAGWLTFTELARRATGRG